MLLPVCIPSLGASGGEIPPALRNKRGHPVVCPFSLVVTQGPVRTSVRPPAVIGGTRWGHERGGGAAFAFFIGCVNDNVPRAAAAGSRTKVPILVLG